MTLLAFCTTAAQEGKKPLQSTSIRVLARSYGDSVVLRWAPSEAAAWELLNTGGYQVMRAGSDAPGSWTKLNNVPIKPLSLEAMKATLAKDDRYAAIAAQALYGKTFTGMRTGAGPAIADASDLLQSRYAYTLQAADFSAPVAKAIGLAWVDRTAVKGAGYIYKVEPATVPAGWTIRAGSVLLEHVKAPKPSVPEGFIAISADRNVELQWPRSQEGGFTAYMVERSTDGKNFKPITTAPYYTSFPDTSATPVDTLAARVADLLRVNHILIDSIASNYNPYYYRLRGIDAFAEWSAYTEPATAMGRDLTPPVAVITGTPENTKGHQVRITWIKSEKEADLKGFYVHRAQELNGDYQLLTPAVLSPATTSFTDTGALETGVNFYIITAIDTAGNFSPSFPVMGTVRDTTAPAIPKGFTGRIDKDGLVHLSWAANKEKDIEGYKVYFANKPDQSFTQLTLYPETTNAFTDSIVLKTLTKKIYYRLVAVDKHNNHSEFSEILELKKPDIIPPTPPAIKNVTVLPGSVQVEFAGSASNDAVAYQLLRRENEGAWNTIATRKHEGSGKLFTFTDTTARHGVKYQYAARTVDEDSLVSEPCIPAQVQLRGIEELPAITSLKATWNGNNKAVQLSWTHKDEGAYHYVIYRAPAGEPLERYQMIGKDQQSYTDLAVPAIGGGYRYAIQVVYDGLPKRTAVSREVAVKQ
jgi:uncharacterized protein